MNDLKPDSCVHKVLLSSRSRFVGEYDHPNEPGVLVTHAWQFGPEMYRNLGESAFSQGFYIAAFRTRPIKQDRPLVVMPEYAYFGEYLAVHFSILYGKHFQSMGMLESNGHFRVPSELHLRPTGLFSLPQYNHRPRKCVSTPLNLCEVSRIRPLFEDSVADSDIGRMLFTAGRFYNRALIEMEEQPELAYLDLVNCGEVISNEQNISDDLLYDDELKVVLLAIEENLKDGAKVSRMIKSRMYQVRRRFSTAIRRLLDDYFFTHPEAKEPHSALAQDTIDESLKAAYDLRSLYVHTGIQFGGWVEPRPHYHNEVQIGQPVTSDAKLQKLLMKAPNLLGLERIMRYSLLKVARDAGAIIDDLFQKSEAEPSP